MTSIPSILPLPTFTPGHVWLVGAGPGDPGLLTVLALHALQNADVVVYDALVDRAILELARSGAILEYAGKRGGKPSASQPDISSQLVLLARQNLRVLRLKGGDPFVFGRGAEEAMTLAKSGIPFRIVPGITAGIGGLAYAGIPATAREANSAIAFVTGHDSSGAIPDNLDWPALARSVPVLVVYMALTHLKDIALRLIAAGRRPEEPAALVSRATTEHQTVITATLGDIAEQAAKHAVEPPAMLVVGDVVSYRRHLDWHGRV
jgi:uroporphyrin-III C-methyltransferase